MRALAVSLLLVVLGCATAGPRFSQSVATTFAHEDMRVLSTPELELHYPAQHRDAALRVAGRAAECVRALRALQKGGPGQRPRALLFLTSANFNNAYVSVPAGGEPIHSVTPLVMTTESLQWLGFGAADNGDVACHEMFHYAHLEQMDGVWGVVNRVIGNQVPNQIFLERWFTEGVAQYYEGRLGRTVGRPHAPLYRAAFESFAQQKGRIEPGDLTTLQRELYPYSGAYLVALHFVEWLVQRSGEDALWKVMQLQAENFFTPFGATLRFKAIYGKDVGDLLAEWSQALQAAPKRARPAEQKVLRRRLGQLARLASHPATGTLALLTVGNDEGPRLRILTAAGDVKVEVALQRIDPGREWILAHPDSMSGLTFSADGTRLYLINDELIDRGDTRAQLWTIDVATGRMVDVRNELGTGQGGALHPSGERYTLIRTEPSGAALIDVELTSGQQHELARFPAGVSVASLSWAPDGSALVFSRLDRAGWNLVRRGADGALSDLTTDGAFNFGARFETADRLVFVRTHEGRAQLHRLTLSTGRVHRLSDVPFGAMDVAPLADGVAFLNRDGSQWTLDRVPGSVLGKAVTPPERPDALGWYAPPPLTVEDDRPYSPFPSVLIPQLRAPFGWIEPYLRGGRLAVDGVVGAVLQGRDRLGWYTWTLSGRLRLPSLDLSVGAAFEIERWAPWHVTLVAARDATASGATWGAALSATRVFGVLPLELGFRGLVRQPFDPDTRRPLDTAALRSIGPSVGLDWGAGEFTSYAGPRRLLALSGSLALYPQLLGSSADYADVRAQADVAVPLPLSTRHSLTFRVAGRALPLAPGGTLTLGSAPGAAIPLNPGKQTGPGPSGAFLPGALLEYVRGYEDFGVTCNAAAVGDVRYRYSFIIDKGFASTLWLLPSLFFRQVDVEAFGTAAITDMPDRRWLRSVGAAAALRVAFMSALPVSLGYQFAYRGDFSLAPLHSLTLSFE